MIFVSERASANLKRMLAKEGTVIEIKASNIVYESISHHPDIFVFCELDKVFVSDAQINQINSDFIDDFIVLEGVPGFKYPMSTSFNAVLAGGYFIHNLKHTNKTILNAIKKRGYGVINVNQAYTRCNLLPVAGKGVITSDMGIGKVLEQNGFDVCYIRSGFINLAGHEYGFIGGCGGKIRNTIYFTGNIKEHPDYIIMKEFIESRDIEIKYDKSGPLTDLGSILYFKAGE